MGDGRAAARKKANMLNSFWIRARALGCSGPASGSRALTATVLAMAAVACGEADETRMLPPQQVAMSQSVAPIYSTDELTVFEVKKGLQFPIIAPEPGSIPGPQDGVVEPYGRTPWITLDDVRVQVSYTVSNLDEEEHNVHLIIDPWTEFGRYWPGLTLIDAEDGEYALNLSGYDDFFPLPGVSAGEASRRHGVITYDDMDEVARDFATVMNLIKFPPAGYDDGSGEEQSALPTYVNHAFHFQNRSQRDPLVQAWVPPVAAGLTGIDFGLLTTEPGADGTNAPNIALEIVVEVTDLGTGKVRREGADDVLLEPTTEIITVGVTP
jgi:hypothetical protein